MAICAQRPKLIEAETKVNNSKVNLAKLICSLNDASEGTDLDDNTVLARGVTRET